ncbi:MAG: tRNA lysidine(34) synthetase TilS, partial [Anaerolineae bacterium]|nr:tRNA lysidine(34) synthetase TilS [Anaerolineae bacterium]
IVQVAGGWQLQVDYAHAYLKHARDEQNMMLTHPLLASADSGPVVVPGMTQLPGVTWTLWAKIIQETGTMPRTGAALALPRNSIVIMRPRRSGDRFTPLGLDGHTQKIKQWMIDHKIPQAIRDRVPLLEIDGQIAAICWGEQWAIADSFRVGKPASRNVIFIHFWIEA